MPSYLGRLLLPGTTNSDIIELTIVLYPAGFFCVKNIFRRLNMFYQDSG